MKLIHRLLGIIVIMLVFVASSAVLIYYTKPVSVNTPFTENQPVFNFEMDESLYKSIEDDNRFPREHTPSAPDAAPTISQTPSSPTGWQIQIGAFAQQENAAQLLKKLQQHDFHVLTRSTVIQGKTITQVIVNPASHDADAQVFLQRLNEVTQLKGRVISIQS